jgi:hypothetical protein
MKGIAQIKGVFLKLGDSIFWNPYSLWLKIFRTLVQCVHRKERTKKAVLCS